MIAKNENEKRVWQRAFAGRFNKLAKKRMECLHAAIAGGFVDQIYTQYLMAIPHLPNDALAALRDADKRLTEYRKTQPQRQPRQLGPTKGKRRGLSKKTKRRS